MLNEFLLKSLQKYKAREKVYLGAESSLQNNDMYFTLIKDGKNYHLRSIEEDYIIAAYYADSESDDAETVKIPMSELSQYKFFIKHHYRLWQLEYNSLLQAYIKNVLGINRLKWCVENRKDNEVISYYEKYKLLTLVLKHMDGSNKVDFFELKREIYGVNSDMRTDYTHNLDLRWKLSALKESKDIDFTDKVLYLSDILVNPKALNTISEYQRDERKHRDSIRMARIQQAIALLLFMSAVINVYFTHIAK